MRSANNFKIIASILRLVVCKIMIDTVSSYVFLQCLDTRELRIGSQLDIFFVAFHSCLAWGCKENSPQNNSIFVFRSYGPVFIVDNKLRMIVMLIPLPLG
ncbi:hypothetical protein PF005_g26330 [Phytophthora fragariae]|uniref:Uncharacterized protein n=1 Tax=Phytophthora fragariae TaxID=53985 RepID=A0A6A3ZDS3_9STRA|nr:hypothetical protein PF003_g13728 [Phytophthora fragariae]KAE8939132.1 hypothetical protein PF009_g11020 [Phytophthora fragariae]KAE9006999.1 hypothetical protein PF011_g11314 [Phytophthora fragariae]KAE9110467.1 hypothetical protein PF007_g11843 [Phytophthora fragariae]KAE9114255.1 hypothetical protein PF010_g9768 [Phytophthora fragariae]